MTDDWDDEEFYEYDDPANGRYVGYVAPGSVVAMGDNSVATGGDLHGDIHFDDDGRIHINGRLVPPRDPHTVRRTPSPAPQPAPSPPAPPRPARPTSASPPTNGESAQSAAVWPPPPTPARDQISEIIALDEEEATLRARARDRRAAAQRTPRTRPTRPTRPVRPARPAGVGGAAEVTGLGSAKQYATGMASAHAIVAPGVESFTGALGAAGVTGDALDAAQRAVEAQQAAAVAWQECQAALQRQEAVAEAYEASPGAGSREFLTNE